MNLPKTISFVFFLLLIASGSLLTKVTLAQVPAPYVPCDEVRPDLLHPLQKEFHSLRPYQVSPCDKEVPETAALFCGNSLVISDTVTSGEASCQTLPDGKLKCIATKSKQIAIDLSGAELPIMGSTELVVNSQEQPDPEGIDDAEKVNEYVSWYLNGVINRAEYPYLDPDDKEDIKKLINFSGPLNKLLPWETQARSRIKTIERAIGKNINKDDKVEDQDRHNQIVACDYGIPVKLFGIFKVGQIGRIPGPCYDNGLLGFIGALDFRDEHRLSEWEKHLPPLIDDVNEKGERKYEDFQEYWVAYKKWRGERCFLIEMRDSFLGKPIPIIGGKKFILCSPIDDPTLPNFWADLFPYIPFSSTEDRVGLVDLDSYTVQPVSEDVTIIEATIEDWDPAELYFAHMQEGVELSNLLQDTFVPSGLEKTGGTTGVSPTGYCDLVNVRANPGDNLYAGEVGATVKYTAEFTCKPETTSSPKALQCNNFGGKCVTNKWSCDYSYGQMDCPQNYECKVNCLPPPQECKKDISVNLSVLTKTPKADEVWERTVAGPASIFKRIFPKVGPGGAILGILDIPAATKVTYTGADFVGNPRNQRSGEGAELYFPHIGGVSEYFLKGIQTILRPKGYGEQILSGQPGTFLSSGDIDCDQSAPGVSLPAIIDKQTAFQLALNWVPGQTGNHVLDCYNDVIRRAQKAGVNPALALWVWLHESNASNYNLSDQDFGVVEAAGQGFVAQITGFISRAKSHTYRASSALCQGTGVTNDLQAWALIYRSGNCDPDGIGKGFYNDLVGAEPGGAPWSAISSCPLPSSPTDTSCP